MPAPPRILGLHHVTAIASDAQKNIDFYAGVLGLKLVKVNVNQDDPTSLHLYYGDDQASPGSLVTFFVHPGIERGRTGWSEAAPLHLSLPADSAEELLERVTWHDLPFRDDVMRTQSGVRVVDAEGLASLLEPDRAKSPRIRGGICMLKGLQATERFLARFLRLEPERRVDVPVPGESTSYFTLPDDSRLQLWDFSDSERHKSGAGTVHHIAFRIAGDDELAELRAKLAEAGVDVSPIIDLVYYKSISFREPGGILLEVATDGPGFAVDEPPDRLGRTLCLPPWLEPRRAEIERAIPRLVLPTGEVLGGR